MLSRHRTLAAVAAAVMISGGIALGGEATLKARDPLLPDDGICLIRLKTVKGLIDGLNGFVNAVQPGGADMLKTVFNARLLTDPAKAGIDVDKPVAVVIFNPKKHKAPWVIAAPLSGDGWGDALEELLGPAEAAGGDLKRYIKVADGPGADTDIYVKVSGGHLVIGASEATVEAVAASVAKVGIDADDVEGTALAAFDVKTLRSLYAEELKGAVTQAREKIAAEEFGPENFAGPLAAFAWIGPVIKELAPEFIQMGVDTLEQIDGLEVGLTVDKDKLALTYSVIAAPDSPLAAALSAQQPVDLTAAEMVPAGGLFSFIGAVNDEALKPHLQEVGGRIRKSLEKAAEGAADDEDPGAAAMRAELIEWAKLINRASLGGRRTAAGGVVPSAGGIANVNVAIMQGIDIDAFVAVFDDIFELAARSKVLGSLNGMMGGEMTMRFEKDVREHDGVKISRFTQDMPNAPAEMRAMMGRLNGMPQVTELALVAEKSAFISTGGKGAAKRMDEMIDLVKSGKAIVNYASSARFGLIKPKLPAGAVVVMDVSPALYTKMVMQMMMPLMGQQMPAELAAGLSAMALTEEPVWGYCSSGAGVVIFGIELPSSSLGKTAQIVQQQMMKMMQPGGMGQPGGPVPPPPPGGGGIGGGVF